MKKRLITLLVLCALLPFGVWGGVSHAKGTGGSHTGGKHAQKQPKQTQPKPSKGSGSKTSKSKAKAPFVSLRGTLDKLGNVVYGSGGYTVTHPDTGKYLITFPAGTFLKGKTLCNFVPVGQVVNFVGFINAASYTANNDGSGLVEFDVTDPSGNPQDAIVSFIAESANC
ncbi:MAG TPA: hypothetical protein VKX16_08505 [Chloroflexota bacterium]|nr:hypothetical protein [Chloroflexota bacterium]